MQQEDKHCTPEQAKRLVEIGVVLDTEWLWDVNSNPLNKNIKLRLKSTIHFDKNFYKDYIFPAPDVAELGVLLGGYVVMKYAFDKCYRLYDERGIINQFISSVNYTEAQARCASLIWLIENELLKPEDIKL